MAVNGPDGRQIYVDQGVRLFSSAEEAFEAAEVAEEFVLDSDTANPEVPAGVRERTLAQAAWLEQQGK